MLFINSKSQVGIGTEISDERREGRYFCVISLNAVVVGTNYINLVEATPILCSKKHRKESSLRK